MLHFSSVSWQCSCKMMHQLSAHPVVSQVDSEYKVRKMSELKCCVPPPWECNQKNFRTWESVLQKGGQKICVSVLPSTEKSQALVILLYGFVASGMIWKVIPAIQKVFCLSQAGTLWCISVMSAFGIIWQVYWLFMPWPGISVLSWSPFYFLFFFFFSSSHSHVSILLSLVR